MSPVSARLKPDKKKRSLCKGISWRHCTVSTIHFWSPYCPPLVITCYHLYQWISLISLSDGPSLKRCLLPSIRHIRLASPLTAMGQPSGFHKSLAFGLLAALKSGFFFHEGTISSHSTHRYAFIVTSSPSSSINSIKTSGCLRTC